MRVLVVDGENTFGLGRNGCFISIEGASRLFNPNPKSWGINDSFTPFASVSSEGRKDCVVSVTWGAA